VAKREKTWVRVRTLTEEEKAAIAANCDRFITETLKPRFLPEIRRTQFNYPVDIFGKWRGNKYSFILRYRSGFADSEGKEFDAAFTRLDQVEEHLADIRFDVMWRRHTGQYWRLHSSVTLEEALYLIETEPFLRPNV
jgi:glutathionyl-hydroquinone reductase